MASPSPPPSPSPSNKPPPNYQPTIPPTALTPPILTLLESYSHIPPSQIPAHISAIRDRAWRIHPYPCIGQFRFLNLSISQHTPYPRILAALKETRVPPRTLLDLGCCFAQDVRKLVHDGVPSAQLYACDLHAEFLDLGYELFRDRDTLEATMFAADVFEPGGALGDIEGQIDYLHAGSFLHLFPWDQQVAVCKRIVQILRPQTGSAVFGRQVGALEAVAVERERGRIWRHDAESFKRMWEIVGAETGTRWKTWAELDVAEGMGGGEWGREGIRRLRFEVQRVE